MSDKVKTQYLYKNNEWLSSHFVASEFAVSSDYPDLAKGIESTETDIKRFRLLVESVLQPVRTLWLEDPINILSGKRSTVLNDKIGGVKTSDHLDSIAVDFTSDDLIKKFLWMYEHIHFRQLIFYPDQNFIHVSINIPGKTYKRDSFIKYRSDKNYIQFTGGQIPPKT